VLSAPHLRGGDVEREDDVDFAQEYPGGAAKRRPALVLGMRR
jgi:hypothetical protein